MCFTKKNPKTRIKVTKFIINICPIRTLFHDDHHYNDVRREDHRETAAY